MHTRLLAALAFILFTGCYATTSHRPDEPIMLGLATDGTAQLAVVQKHGPTVRYDAPFTTSLEDGTVVVTSSLTPTTRYDADELERLDVTSYDQGRSEVAKGVLVGAGVVTIVGAVVLGVAAAGFVKGMQAGFNFNGSGSW